MSGRTAVLAGNWKMHKSPSEARAFAIELRERLKDLQDREVIVFPPATALPAVADELRNSRIACGGQNIHWQESGAFTGETAPGFLTDLGCTHVLVGHSERRHLFGEDNETCGRKTRAALDAGLVPVLCCGETAAQRDAGKTQETVICQLQAGLAGVTGSEEFLVAYEPVWAIGTGRNATPAQAAEVHAWIRFWLGQRFSPDSAAEQRILYGGSVKPGNIDVLMAEPEIDGVLVGGASLDVSAFERIVRFIVT